MNADFDFITTSASGVCPDCGKQDELRPYGKNGAIVCFDCAMKDPEEMERQFTKVLNTNDVVIVGG